MAFDSLTKEQLDLLLANTSPHSFKFNVLRFHEKHNRIINTEPTTETEKLGTRLEDLLISYQDQVREELTILAGIIKDLKGSDTTPDSGSDLLVCIATLLAGVMFHRRSIAAQLGLPMEEIVEGCLGLALSDSDHDPLVVTSTIMHGIQ